MSAVVELTDALTAAGMSPGEAASLIARAHAEMAAPSLSKGAIRTRRWRERKASQNVTERHAVTPENPEVDASQSVTYRHKASPCDAPSLSKKEEDIKKERKRERRAQQLSDAWEHRPEDWAFAVSQLGEAASLELQKFKDHARAKGRTAKDWDAAWRNWVRRAVEYRGGTPLVEPVKLVEPSGFYAAAETPELEAWDEYRRANEGKTWPRDARGGWHFPTQWPPEAAAA